MEDDSERVKMTSSLIKSNQRSDGQQAHFAAKSLRANKQQPRSSKSSLSSNSKSSVGSVASTKAKTSVVEPAEPKRADEQPESDPVAAERAEAAAKAEESLQENSRTGGGGFVPSYRLHLYSPNSTSSYESHKSKPVVLSAAKKRFMRLVRVVMFCYRWSQWATRNYRRTVHRYMSFSQVFVPLDECRDEDEIDPSLSVQEQMDAKLRNEMHSFNLDQFRTGAKTNAQVDEPTLRLLRKSSPRTQTDVGRLKEAFKGLGYVEIVARLDSERQSKFFECCWLEEYEARRVVASQGHRAEYFYIILTGSMACTHKAPGERKSTTVSILDKGMTFGELPILNNTAHTCTISSRQRVSLLVVTRDHFLKIFVKPKGAAAAALPFSLVNMTNSVVVNDKASRDFVNESETLFGPDSSLFEQRVEPNQTTSIYFDEESLSMNVGRSQQQQQQQQLDDADLYESSLDFDDPLVNMLNSKESRLKSDAVFLKNIGFMEAAQLRNLVNENPGTGIQSICYKRGEIMLRDSKRSKYIYIVKSGSASVWTRVVYNKHDRTKREKYELIQRDIEKELNITIDEEAKTILKNSPRDDPDDHVDGGDEVERAIVHDPRHTSKHLDGPEAFRVNQAGLLKENHMEVSGLDERRRVRRDVERARQIGAKLDLLNTKTYLSELKQNEAIAKNFVDKQALLTKRDHVALFEARAQFVKAPAARRATDDEAGENNQYDEESLELVTNEALNDRLKSRLSDENLNLSYYAPHEIRQVAEKTPAPKSKFNLPKLSQPNLATYNSLKNSISKKRAKMRASLGVPEPVFDAETKHVTVSPSKATSVKGADLGHVSFAGARHREDPSPSEQAAQAPARAAHGASVSMVNYKILKNSSHSISTSRSVLQSAEPNKNATAGRPSRVRLNVEPEEEGPLLPRLELRRHAGAEPAEVAPRKKDGGLKEWSARQVGQRKEATDSEEVVEDYIKLNELIRGQNFGLSDVLFDVQPSMQLISNGCECLVVSKDLYLQYAGPGRLVELRSQLRPYPNIYDLETSYRTHLNWLKFKNDYLSHKIANRSRVWNKTELESKPGPAKVKPTSSLKLNTLPSILKRRDYLQMPGLALRNA